MKYSQLLGLLSSIGGIFVCFIPWIFIAELNIVLTGMNEGVPDFGRPGLLNIILCVLMSVFFVIPAVWAKRINVIVAAINLAWSLRNFLLLSLCHSGECPERRTGIYLLLCLSVFILIMTLLPPNKVNSVQS